MKRDTGARNAFVDGDYRYWLSRNWRSGSNRVTFIGLNPSTADAMQDDPTIRKCVGFAKRWGFGSLLMLNLSAYRATDPRELSKAMDVFGNRQHYWAGFDQVKRGSIVICAWGGKKVEVDGFDHWPTAVVQALRQRGAFLRALHINKDGSPKPPLYCSYKTKLVHYRGVDL